MSFGNYIEQYANLLGVISSALMFLVTSIYAVITWWQARYSKQTLITTIKQNREERQPFVVPTIKEVTGCAFNASTYIRVQLSFQYSLENVGDSAAVTLYTFLYARMEYQNEHKLVYAHLIPNYRHSLKVGQEIGDNIHFETDEFRDIIEDLKICHAKNVKRIETDATVPAFRGPTIILQTIYKNMVGQWFESVLEQELLDIEKPSKKPEKEVGVYGEKIKIKNRGKRGTNKEIKDGDVYEGYMINPAYSKLTRRVVDADYVNKVIENCRQNSDSSLEYMWI